MAKWKKLFEDGIGREFPGVSVKWNGENPTLVVPDNRKRQKRAIVAFSVVLAEELGVVIKFNLEP